ncbi:hypothetical protein FVI83_17400 [Salmonella enterica subsp. diarizonae]|nr:hypothetical protein [Salmonella enterica subsp. diarizonae]ECJ5865374.1 hypothetical protein [Salmonella enterica subsp. diarizonae]EEB6126598.1 hypothetical protein [Salmonella enterica subsp. diarizonae]
MKLKLLEERVAALEKHLGEQTSPDMLKAIYEVSKKAADDLLSHQSIGFSFRMVDEGGKLRITGPGKNTSPTEKHRDEIIRKVIQQLSQVQHMNRVSDIFKTTGRCMGYLQVATEIQAEIEMGYASDKGKCLDDIIKAFDHPPLKNISSDWVAPGMAYLKKRMSRP